VRVEPRAAWAFLPVTGALLAHAPVLRYDVAPGLKRPLDGGRTLRGRRLLGDNKTWRGALVMFSGAAATTLLLSRAAWFRSRLPPDVAGAPAPAFAALLGTATVVSELPTSMLKRQVGIAPGAQRRSPLGVALSLYDQGDFVVGGALLLRPLWRMSARELSGAFLLVSAAHLASNLVGYAIGARTSPI
jgi:CDP-2,3-bis-(O-geranylgeranyl)-sn-glycerol synthase